MGKTILCSSCKSTFDEDILMKKGNGDICPVCGESLSNAPDNSKAKETLSFGDEFQLSENDSFDEDQMDFWWYAIREPGTLNETDTGHVTTICAKCSTLSFAMYPIARTGDYILLNPKETDSCSHCGNQLKNHILSKRPADWVSPRPASIPVQDHTPKCPTCGSPSIKKISAISKAGSVAMWGLFSRKVHKQWHCNHCGSEW